MGKIKNNQLIRSMLAKFLVVLLFVLAVKATSSALAKGVTEPSISNKSCNILIGDQYNLNINNKVKNSNYKWSTSDKDIATVTQRGIVTGISKGKATITCKVTTPQNTYNLTSEVTIRIPAEKLAIKNKVSALNVGQEYDFNRTLNPSNSNDITTWTSSNEKIAVPNKKGILTALKKGTVTITGETLSGATDSVTFKVVDEYGTVTNQKELDTLLGSGASLITIKTKDDMELTISDGDYSKQIVIVDAPNAKISNYGVFKLIKINDMKSKAWHEMSVGNTIQVYAKKSSIIIAENASATIEVNKDNANLNIENNGEIKEININNISNINLVGKSTRIVNVNVNHLGSKLTTSVPINLTIMNFELNLQPGSDDSKFNIPSLDGNIVIDLTDTSGENTDNEKEEEQGPSITEPIKPSPNPTPVDPDPTPVDPDPTPVDPEPTPSDNFIDLNQEEIVQAMGAGWNLGNQLEATLLEGIPGETNWGNPVITKELIKAVKDAGFNHIRIPVSYLGYIGSAPEYTINEAWLDRIQEVVDYCMDNGLYAIINVHGDGYHTVPGGWLLPDEADQETIRAKYEAVWSQIATRFKDYDQKLVFESMNEMFDGKYADPDPIAYANINTYNQIFLDTIRRTGGNNDMRWVLVPGWNTNIEYTAGNWGFEIPTDTYLSDKVPTGEKRIMISVHYYEPWDFCGGESGQITQWGENTTNPSKTSTHSDQSYMAAQFKLLVEKFISNGYPVVIGEYGSIDKTEFDEESNLYRAYFARKVAENSVKYGVIPTIWDNGYNGRYGFGLFDRQTATITQPQIIDAIMDVYHSDNEDGTATGITLDQTDINMTVGDEPIALVATLTPADSNDIIKWSSSDESVAIVSDNGVVKAYTFGTAIITATANGHSAQCIVNVTPSSKLSVGLYALETGAWSTIKSLTNVNVTSAGGTYTLSINGSKEMLSRIGSLYLKDAQVQSGILSKSIYSSSNILINSVKFNGVELTVNQLESEQAITKDGVLDFSIVNIWAPEESQKVKEIAKNENGDYYFTGVTYTDNNIIEVTFTISDIVVDTTEPETPEPEPEEPVDPSDSIKTNINSMRYDYTITGITDETSLTFSVTDTNWNDVSTTIELNGDGEYSVDLDFNNSEGLINLGYFTTVSGSTITAKLNKIMVNDTYELSADGELVVGSENENGLSNIWNTDAGIKIAQGPSGYIELNSDKSAFEFFTINNTPTAKNILSIQYEFAISGMNGESELTFKNQTSSWAESTYILKLDGEGDYVIKIALDNAEGFINLGYFESIDGSEIKATLSKIIINEKYGLTIESILEIGDSNKNALKNIWNAEAGVKIAEGTNCYIQYNADLDVIKFYAIN